MTSIADPSVDSKPSNPTSTTAKGLNMYNNTSTEPSANASAVAFGLSTTASKSTNASTYDSTNALTNASVVKIVQNSPLLSLPPEVKEKIWILCVTVEGSIEPIQLKEKSNKFLWNKDQCLRGENGTLNGRRNINISAAKPLDVVALSTVCKQVYEEVSLTHLFYQVNKFDFRPADNLSPKFTFSGTNTSSMANYLVAITKPRRDNIHSIIYEWTRFNMKQFPVGPAFTMLSECRGLKELNLHVRTWGLHNCGTDFQTLKGFKELKNAVKGLSVLSIDFGPKPPPLPSQELKAKFENILQLEKHQPKGPSNLNKIQEAMIEADLDIHGEGRLSQDKKPDIVSSRTRQSVRRIGTINHDGILPKRETPKYDFNGTLAWVIKSIKESREIVDDIGDVGVEFKVIYRKTSIHYGDPAEEGESWENFSVMDPYETACDIEFFYSENPDAFGKEHVLKAWKQLLADKDRSFTDRGMLKLCIKSVEAVMKKIAEKERYGAGNASNAVASGKKIKIKLVVNKKAGGN